VAGVTGLHREEDYRSRLVGPGSGGEPFVDLTQRRDDNADEAALFSEVTYRVNEWLDLTGGIRLFYASVGADAQVYQGASGITSPARGNNAESDMTRKAVIDVRPWEDVTLYASVGEGFRLGGINIDGPAAAGNVNAGGGEETEGVSAHSFASDTLLSYELGAKTGLLNGALIANGALFLTHWDNIQSDQILPDGLLYIANAGNVRAPGAEADLSYQFTPHWHMQLNGFWSDPKITHANPLLVQTVGRLPGVPESSAALSLRYDFSLADDDAFLIIGGQYLGGSYAGFDVTNSPPMGNYLTGNLRLGLRHGPWRAALSIDNLGNTRANSFSYGNPFTFDAHGQSTPLRPLTVGVTLGRSF
jgi:outer membrane receptor protein involved in Fe transport